LRPDRIRRVSGADGSVVVAIGSPRLRQLLRVGEGRERLNPFLIRSTFQTKDIPKHENRADQ